MLDLPPVAIDKPGRTLRQKQIIRDRRDLFRLAPGLFQPPQLALQRAALLLLVLGHLKGQARMVRHGTQEAACAPVAILPPALGGLVHEPLGMPVGLDLRNRRLDLLQFSALRG